MTLDAATGLLACPHCREPLTIGPQTVTCARGHSYDIARQRYVNLLDGPEPANADTAAMVAARQRVHAAGLFDPVAAAVAAAIRSGAPRRVLEVGAGPAAYLRRCLGDDPAARGVALDVSRAAAKAAARADARIAAVVADVWKAIPLLDGSVDAVLAVFAPRNPVEFARVLRPGGRLVVVTPTPAHLAALRTVHGLLDIPDDKGERLDRALGDRFEPTGTTTVSYPISVDPELARDLVEMGPNAFHRVPERTQPLTDRIEVTLTAWVTCHPPTC